MKQTLYAILFFFLASCTSNTIYKEPENLIPKDSMMSLLTDMYIASSAKNIKNKIQEKNVNYMILVYDKYKIDSTRFDESNMYYTSKNEEYSDMLKEIKKRVEVKRKFFEEKINYQDSVAGAKAQKIKKDTLLKKGLGKDLNLKIQE